jgi:DMSO reductase anchor subunit
MNPAWSVIFFTTLAGAAQGMVVTLALSKLTGLAPNGQGFTAGVLLVALVMLLVSLLASFLHLGHPERAWRAVLMWRTSWLSREVIVLPAFIAAVALWWWMVQSGRGSSVKLMMLVVVLAALLWLCTAMIYACLRFIAEWAHALTVVNYALIGLASGCTLLAALASVRHESGYMLGLAPWALGLTLAAWATRTLALWRNAGLKPRSTLQSATGIQHAHLRQHSMGMSAGAFNTREFMHGMSLLVLQRVRWALHGLCFALPALLVGAGFSTGAHALLPLAVAVQALGLLAERWFFFAQAQHPQNLYYQVVA